MILDFQLQVSSAQDLSQSASDYYSTKVVNMSHVLGDPGSGEPFYLIIVVDEAFASSGSATVQFAVIDEADTTLDGSSVIIVQTRAIAYATLTLGKIIVLPIPAGIITQQYIGMRVDIGTATTTAGTVTATFGFGAQTSVPH